MRAAIHLLLLCRNLYEVFCNVRDDEQEHVKTMHACADYSIVEQIAKMKVRGLHHAPADLSGKQPTCMSDSAAMLQWLWATAKVGRGSCEPDTR